MTELRPEHMKVTSGFFSEGQLGPLELRNRSIRAAAFEGMCPDHNVSDELIEYHTSLSKGGVGMTTVAYASVSKSGLSFSHQLWVREEVKPQLKKLASSVHKHGAKISIQLGHAGNMADRKVTGVRPLGASGRFNMYGPNFPKRLSAKEIQSLLVDFKNAVRIVADAGFDAVEIHAGHGYLISQFLSPYSNKRKDAYGGNFTGRSKFLKEVLLAVKNELPGHMALLVKMNFSDGFKGGVSEGESLKAAVLMEQCGVDGIIVSGGFVSKSPMYILRGKMPMKIMSYFLKDKTKKFIVRYFGRYLMPEIPFKEGYFFDQALKIKNEVGIPIILLGGMNSMGIIRKAMDAGFEFIGFARALIEDPDFINNLKNEVVEKSNCTVCNYCVAKINGGAMSCHLHDNIQDNVLSKLVADL